MPLELCCGSVFLKNLNFLLPKNLSRPVPVASKSGLGLQSVSEIAMFMIVYKKQLQFWKLKSIHFFIFILNTCQSRFRNKSIMRNILKNKLPLSFLANLLTKTPLHIRCIEKGERYECDLHYPATPRLSQSAADCARHTLPDESENIDLLN